MTIDEDNLLNSSPDDLTDEERDLRLRNQLKYIELTAKYDAHFYEGESELPSHVEEQWLNNMEEFEKQFQQGKRTTVREFVGNPTLKSPDDIPAGKLQDELDRVLHLLTRKNVILDFLCDVPDAEAYRFIREELFDEEMDDIQIEGMHHHFIYEEFHPNDEYDAKQCAEDFLSSMF